MAACGGWTSQELFTKDSAGGEAFAPGSNGPRRMRRCRQKKDRMGYAGLARRGLPLGSGVTESAAKTVINQRAKGAGPRWKEPELRAVFGVRSILQSARMPAFWLHFSRLYVANITCAAPRERSAA